MPSGGNSQFNPRLLYFIYKYCTRAALCTTSAQSFSERSAIFLQAVFAALTMPSILTFFPRPRVLCAARHSTFLGACMGWWPIHSPAALLSTTLLLRAAWLLRWLLVWLGWLGWLEGCMLACLSACLLVCSSAWNLSCLSARSPHSLSLSLSLSLINSTANLPYEVPTLALAAHRPPPFILDLAYLLRVSSSSSRWST